MKYSVRAVFDRLCLTEDALVPCSAVILSLPENAIIFESVRRIVCGLLLEATGRISV